jgi:hypothetical protein
VRGADALADAAKLGWLSPWLNYQLRHARALPAGGFDLRTLPLGRRKVRGAVLADPWGWLQASGARFVVVPFAGTLDSDASFRALRAALCEHAELVYGAPGCARDGTGPAGHEVPLDVGDSSAGARRNWTGCLLSGEAVVGDCLEIWRMP